MRLESQVVSSSENGLQTRKSVVQLSASVARRLPGRGFDPHQERVEISGLDEAIGSRRTCALHSTRNGCQYALLEQSLLSIRDAARQITQGNGAQARALAPALGGVPGGARTLRPPRTRQRACGGRRARWRERGGRESDPRRRTRGSLLDGPGSRASPGLRLVRCRLLRQRRRPVGRLEIDAAARRPPHRRELAMGRAPRAGFRWAERLGESLRGSEPLQARAGGSLGALPSRRTARCCALAQIGRRRVQSRHREQRSGAALSRGIGSLRSGLPPCRGGGRGGSRFGSDGRQLDAGSFPLGRPGTRPRCGLSLDSSRACRCRWRRRRCFHHREAARFRRHVDDRRGGWLRGLRLCDGGLWRHHGRRNERLRHGDEWNAGSIPEDEDPTVRDVVAVT